MDSPEKSLATCAPTHLFLEFWQLDHTEELIEGATGWIYRALWQGIPVAVTKYHSERDFKQFMTIAPELAQLSHPHLVKVIGIIREPGCCVAELVPGVTLEGYLETALADPAVFPWSERLRIARQLAQAMSYLHEQSPPFIHRNLTSANVLLTSPKLDVRLNIVRLTRDIGFSCDTAITGLLPPELLQTSQAHWSEKSDVYCFGIIVWELITLEMPDLSQEFVPEVSSTDQAPPALLRLVHCCLERTPSMRPTFDELVETLSHSSLPPSPQPR
jgi:serine/threonine protein kinase